MSCHNMLPFEVFDRIFVRVETNLAGRRETGGDLDWCRLAASPGICGAREIHTRRAGSIRSFC